MVYLVKMDDGENYCEAEIDRIAYYEEKKLLIQNAEERCDYLNNQLENFRILQTLCNDHEKQDEQKMMAPHTNSSKEYEFNICDSSKIPIIYEENQSHSKYQSPLIVSPEICVTFEDGYLDDGASGGLAMLDDTDQEKLCPVFDSTVLHDKAMSSQFNSSYNENNSQDSSTSEKNFDEGEFQDELVRGKCDDHTQIKGERDEIKACEILEKLKNGKRGERKVMLEKVTKKNTIRHSVRQPNKPLDNATHKQSPLATDNNQTKRSKINEHLQNYKRPPMRTTSIISVSKVPTLSFKKENERYLPNKNVHKLTNVIKNGEESKQKIESKIPSRYLRNGDPHENEYDEKTVVNHFRGSKTVSWTKGNFDDKESGQYVAAKSKKIFSRKLISEANPRQSVSMQWRAIWTHRANDSEGQLGQRTEAHSDLNTKHISVHMVKKALNSLPSAAKVKEKNRLFCSENRELDNNKSRVLRNGFGLHTISSKLKMSEKMHNKKHCSKYPFVVGKATTPSHNLVLNIQQTLSIIKMKPQAVHSQATASGAIECHDFPSITTTDGLMTNTLRMDPVMFVQTHSSISGIPNCPLINQSSIATCIIQSDVMETQDWYLFQEKYGDATVNRCQCYPRKFTNYHKVINQYLTNENEMQFLHENNGLQSYGQPKKCRQMDVNQGVTIRERLTQILRQVQTFQGMLTSKPGI